MAFRVENLEALARGRRELESFRDSGSKVISRAIGTLKRRLPVQAKRDIGAQYALPAREIASRLRCTGNSGAVTLTALGRNMTLIKFKAKQNRSGVTAQITKGSSALIAHAFIQIPRGAPGAGPQVLIRAEALNGLPEKVQTLAVVRHAKHGYPLVLLGGPSVADMLRDPGREDRLSDFVQTTFAAEIDRLIQVARNGR
jgi:hypothetical protein